LKITYWFQTLEGGLKPSLHVFQYIVFISVRRVGFSLPFPNHFAITHNIILLPRAGTRPAPTTHNHFNASVGVGLVPTLGYRTKHHIQNNLFHKTPIQNIP
jgi:hypothetical protein